MGKNKLTKFAQMDTFPNVFQYPAITLKESMKSGIYAPLAGTWSNFFHNDNPIVLELGCGRGEYTVALSERYPDKNFIGVDIKGARMWAGAKQALEMQLPNAAFLRTNIELIDKFFLPNEVSEIWITFADPQMKKATKRLTSSYFMQRYKHIMKPDGIVHLKTDSPFLYTYTAELVKANHFNVLINTADLYSELTDPLLLSIQTHYEKQWLERGMKIKYLSFCLPHLETYIEPEVEIEPDDYRSYGRFGRDGKKSENRL